MTSGAPDWTRIVRLSVTVGVESEMIPLPKADTGNHDSATTNTTTYTEIAVITPADGETFRLLRIDVTAPSIHYIQVLLDSVVKHTYIVPPDNPFVDIFQWGDFYKLVGDGAKKAVLQAKAKDTGGTVYGSIVGAT